MDLKSGGQMVISWTLFRAASQDSGLSGLQTSTRPDVALASFLSRIGDRTPIDAPMDVKAG
jgi:hypothetical protein